MQRKKRESLMPSNPTVDEIGLLFPFVNREKESAVLFEILADLDKKAIKKKNVDSIKSSIVVPVCEGISQIGKTSFARKSLPIYCRSLLLNSSDPLLRNDPVKHNLCSIFANEEKFITIRFG
jgi:hypothetical protein